MKCSDLLLALCETAEVDEFRGILNHNNSMVQDLKREGYELKRGTTTEGAYYFMVDYPLRGLDADIVFFDVHFKERGVDFLMFGYVVDDLFNGDNMA